MAMYTVDVYSGSPDSVIQDPHAQGVIVKATQGNSYVNPRCNHQWELAGSLGKLRGLYHYAGGGNPESEAQYFITNIKNYVGQGMLFLDWESYQNAAWGDTSWALRFVTEVHRLTGVWPTIYVQESALWQVANCAKLCGVWVAKYISMNWNSWAVPNMSVSAGTFGVLTGWQFTGGDMDRSIFYLTKETWQKMANPNGSADGWQGSGDTWQYYENGSAVKNDWRKVDGKWYHFDNSGNAEVNWKQINNHWYYFNPNHDGTFAGAVTGWQEINGKKYYFDPQNAWMLTGKQTIDEKSYVFDENGALQGQADDQKPVEVSPTSSTTDSKEQLISDDIKSYIQSEVKTQLSKLKIKIEE